MNWLDMFRKKKKTFRTNFAKFSFESLESYPVFNYLHDSNSIFGPRELIRRRFSGAWYTCNTPSFDQVLPCHARYEREDEWVPINHAHEVDRNSDAGTVLPVALYIDGMIGLDIVNMVSGARRVVAVLRNSANCQCGCQGWCTPSGTTARHLPPLSNALGLGRQLCAICATTGRSLPALAASQPWRAKPIRASSVVAPGATGGPWTGYVLGWSRPKKTTGTLPLARRASAASLWPRLLSVP